MPYSNKPTKKKAAPKKATAKKVMTRNEKETAWLKTEAGNKYKKEMSNKKNSSSKDRALTSKAIKAAATMTKAAPRKSPFKPASKETIDGVNRTESAIRYLKRK